MKVKGFWDWGFFARPYLRSCDELCNEVFIFAVPFVGGVEFFTEDRKFSDGLWYTSGMVGMTAHGNRSARLSVATYGAFDVMVTADIVMSMEEAEAAFGDADDSHPKLWTDSEVLSRASYFERYSEYLQDFVAVEPHAVRAILSRPAALDTI